tara:strand:+ start:430 stop:597 length:168 start_codon:yes stop_codon:yes gene_type:complete
MRYRKYIRFVGEGKRQSLNVDVLPNDVKKDMLMRIEKRIDKEIQQQIYRRYGVVC